MPATIDPSRYVYHPGVDEVKDVDLDVTPVFVDGKRYTEADAERDSLEDENRFRARAGLIPGGKSLSGGRKHSPTFQVVVGEATAEKVRAAAREAGMSVSKWIRRTLEDKVA